MTDGAPTVQYCDRKIYELFIIALRVMGSAPMRQQP